MNRPAWICLTGDELVEGRLIDTNGPWLAQQMIRRGHDVARLVSVGDDATELRAVWDQARREASVLVVSGGLGGTADDLTRYVLADLIGRPLVCDAPTQRRLAEFWRSRGREVQPELFAEALIPEGARLVPNPVGLAPGIHWREESFELLALPGVPRELKAMVANGALDGFRGGGRVLEAVTVCLFGVPESRAAEQLADLLARRRNPLVGIAAKDAHLELTVRATGTGAPEARELVERDLARIVALFGDAIFSTAGAHLPVVVAEALLGRGLKLALAESLTGGYVGHLLTEVPGISGTLLADFVTYSNASKVTSLGVPEQIIAAHGAVSEEVARAMASGARARTGADVGVATTGIAGPSGGSPAKPVGTAWVAVSGPGDAVTVEVRTHAGDRAQIKRRAAHHALDLLRRVLARVG